MTVDDLRHFRNLKLTELKVKLVEGGGSSKSLIPFSFSFSNPLSNKNGAVRQFAEGSSANTLRNLDIAGSTVRFKTVKQLFWMAELEKLVLDDCSQIGHEFEPISPKILHLSLINLPVTINHLSTLLQKTSILVHLNVIGTKISKKDLVFFITSKRKYINNLKISEEQYSNKLLEYPTSSSSPNGKVYRHLSRSSQAKTTSPQKREEQEVFDYIENIEIYIDKLLENEQENQFHYLLYKASRSYKTLRLVISSEVGLTGNRSYDELVKIHREH